MNTLVFKDFEAFKEMQGKELPTTNWIFITQEMITDFANATFDKQWIHIDEKRAEKESPFTRPVAHGFMSVAMIPKLLEEVFSIKSMKMGLNYGLNKVRFPNPVPVNSELRMLSTVKTIENLGDSGIKVTVNCILEIKNQEKPACVAEFIAALFE